MARLTVAVVACLVVGWSVTVAAAGRDGSQSLTLTPRSHVTVGPSANGGTIRLRHGDTLVVRLPGNLTTGYRWSIFRLPPSLRLINSTYVPSAPKRLGQGGSCVLRFRARKGSGILRLVYQRPWEKGKPPLRTYAVTVRVR